MKQTIDAIFESGVFRPLQSPQQVAEGQQVKLIVASGEASDPPELLDLAASVYRDLAPEQIEQVEAEARRRPLFPGEHAA